jgi:hypothetical protein
MTIPPMKAGALWIGYDQIGLYRHSNARLDPVYPALTFGVGFHVWDDYPDE